MNIRLQLLVASCLLMLAIAGCDKDTGGTSSTPASSQARHPETVLQQPAVQLRANDFPTTPQKPALELSSSETFVDKDDSNLSKVFLNASGARWNQALLEMKKRQTPALVSVMAKNLDEMRGIAVVSGEAMYAPELRYPVARVLMECGDKPIAELIAVCTSSNTSLKRRILAARVLRHLGASGQQAAEAEKIRSTLRPSELSIFNDLWAMAQDDVQASSVLGDQ